MLAILKGVLLSFILFRRSVRIIFNISNAAEKITSDRGYNPHKKLIIFIHGFTDNPTKSAFTTISEALLKTGKF